MSEFRKKVALGLFGRERTGDVCVSCGSKAIKPKDFRDDLSRQEWSQSNFCQKCQDSVFVGKE